QSVTLQDEIHSHWVLKTIGGKFLEWDAEIIEQRENEMISWRSAPGADVDNAGSVWFTPVPGGKGTLIRVELKYLPRGRGASGLVAKVFGRDAKREIAKELGRFKSLLEGGQFFDKKEPPALKPVEGGHAVKASDVDINRWSPVVSLGVGVLA